MIELDRSQPFSGNNLPASFNLTQRTNDLLAKISNLYKKISPEIKISGMRIDSFNSTPCLDQRYPYSFNWNYPYFHITSLPAEIVLPAYYLFKNEDFPVDFQIQDFNDPRLNDEQYLRSFAEWLNSTIQSINNSEQDNHLPLLEMPKDLSEFRNLRRILMHIRDPILFEKMKEHTIGHELCHGLDKNQSHFLFLEGEGSLSYAPTIGILGGLALCATGAICIPLISLPAGLTIAGSGIILGATTFALARLGFSKCCEIEKNCDLRAIEVLQDASGAIYGFETDLQLNILEKSQNPSLPIDDKGNMIYDVKHPRLTSRISYCQEWHHKES